MTTDPPRVIDSPYLTTREAMAYLRLTSPSSLYYLINEQRLPHLRRGGRLLFDRRDVDAWLRGTDAVSLARARRRAG
jgi:excisionase family DNA binding protein